MYGNRKQKESKLYRTKPECKDAEADFLIKSKIKDEFNSNITFKEVYDEWLEYKKNKVKDTTIYNNVNKCNLYILPYFKKYKLHSIKVQNINNWKKSEIENIKAGLDHKNTIITLLKEILEYAVNNYEFDIKIVSKIQKYKVDTVSNKLSDAEINYWTFEDFKKFIDVVDDKMYYLMFTFLYYTGLRLGEMIALTWLDFNPIAKTIRVNKTFTDKVLDLPYKITTPKTKNSIRIVDLDDNLVELLQEHKKEEEKIYNFNDSMFLFGNAKHIAPTSFKRYLYSYINKIKINDDNFKRITPHGFRHSHVSLLINLGCDSKDVAERIGDTVQMVEKTYYHMFPDKKKETVKILNKLVQKQEVNKR